MKALFATAAIVLATSASANTVSLSNYAHKDATGFGTAFDDVFTLNLGSDTWLLNGGLNTGSLLGGLPAIDIQSVTLRHLGTTFNWAETVAINWELYDGGVETWALTPKHLAAGQWQIEVKGVSYYDKAGNGYAANIELPEPGSAPLAALALIGAGAACARRRKA